jgi:hypothetical protein
MDVRITELRSTLAGWKEQRPAVLAQLDEEIAVSFGERHGSWFTQFAWTASGLHRAAELAITNATSLDDSQADVAHISVRASASSDTHWIATSIYDRRRTLSRVGPDDLTRWLAAAVQVASSFTSGALTDTYALPGGQSGQ